MQGSHVLLIYENRTFQRVMLPVPRKTITEKVTLRDLLQTHAERGSINSCFREFLDALHQIPYRLPSRTLRKNTSWWPSTSRIDVEIISRRPIQSIYRWLSHQGPPIRPQSSPSYQRGQREVLRRFEVPTVAGLGTFWRTGAGEKDLIEFDAEHR